MKAVLLSIQPKWCELIASGKKTVEIRKTKPKIDVPFKCYIYCTNVKGQAFFTKGENGNYNPPRLGNRKVIGEFVCDEIDTYTKAFWDEQEERDTYDIARLVYHSRIKYNDLRSYVGEKAFYAWHISDLVIYDKPRELSEFKSFCKFYYDCDGSDSCKYYIDGNSYEYDESDCGSNGLKPIERPPQSWMYVEELP